MYFSQKVGTLVVLRTRGAGKVIDEWQFKSPLKGVEPMVVEVVIVKGEGGGITLTAKSKALPEPISNPDIEVLRNLVEETLRAQHQMLTGLTWETWLEVEVRGRRESNAYRNDVDSNITVRYRRLKRAVDPATNKAYTINGNDVAVPFPKPKAAGALEEGDKILSEYIKGTWSGRDPEAEYSYIPETEENLAGLEDLMSRMQSLRAALSDFLSQDSIGQALVGLSSASPVLPAPL